MQTTALNSAVRERQLRRVTHHDLDVAQFTGELTRLPRQIRVDFDGGEPIRPGRQRLGGQSGPRPELEYVVPQLDPVDRVRQQALTHQRVPLGARAIPPVEAVHSPNLRYR